MPSAFDRGTPQSDHSPLQNLLAFDPSKPLLSIQQLIDQWLSSITEFIFPLVKELTGIDLSSPDAFFGSLGMLILNGGSAVMGFVNSIVRFVVDAVTGLTGGGLPDLTAWAEGVAGSLAGVVGGLASLVSSLLSAPASVLGEIPQSLVAGLSGVLSGISTTVGDAVSGLESLLNSLLHNPAAVLGSIPQGLVTGLSGALGSITAFVQGVINTIWSALRGIPIVGGFVPGIPELAAAVVDNNVNLQNATISNSAMGGGRNPSWVARFPVADVTYPEIFNIALTVTGVTGAQSTGTAHTHTLPGLDDAYAAPGGPGSLIPPGSAMFGIITPTNTGVIDTLVAALRIQSPATTINNVFLEFLRMNETTGDAKVVASVNVAASVPTGTEAPVEGTIPGVISQGGESYLFRIRNSTNNSAVLFTNALRATTFLNDRFGAASAVSGLAANTSYTSSEVTSILGHGGYLPWGMAAIKAPVVTDRSFSDDANRSTIGGLWFGKSSTAALLDIYDNEFGYTGSVDGDQSAIYIHPTSRVGSRVEANLNVNPASTARLGVLLHCNRELTQIVYLGVNSTSSKIYSGPHDSLTERASLSVGGTALWAGFYDEANDKYVVLKDGVDIGLEWLSVGSAVEHDSDYEYGGIRIEMAGGEPAGTIDNFTLRDWVIAVPALVNAPVMAATASMPAPVVTASVSVTAPVMAATAAMTAPHLEAGARVTAPVMAATASMPAPETTSNDVFPYIFPFNLG